jgi:hypothetical protein
MFVIVLLLLIGSSVETRLEFDPSVTAAAHRAGAGVGAPSYAFGRQLRSFADGRSARRQAQYGRCPSEPISPVLGLSRSVERAGLTR